MKSPKPISDEEAVARLNDALHQLGTADGTSTASDTALKTARRVLFGLSMGLRKSIDDREGVL